jgi:antitoxin VapB
MLTRTSLFLSDGSQAVRLPEAVDFTETVREVVIVPDGPRRIITPAEVAWDDVFDAAGTDLPPREQPAMHGREGVSYCAARSTPTSASACCGTGRTA